MTDITHTAGYTTLADYDFTWDNGGRLTQEVSDDGTVNFSYDTTGQLTAASGGRTESYSYDDVGNRDMTGYSTGTGNRLLSDGSFNYTYDDEGNLLTKTDIATDEMTEYTWDYRNRLTNVTVKDSSDNVIQESDYTYDPFDKRIGVEVDPDGDGVQSATERWTAYDGANPYADFDGSGNLTHRYLYGPATDMILARMDDSEEVAWYLTDHLGSVRDLADPGGNVIDHITYDSFGNVLSESDPSVGDRFKYTGRELDAETGLYYYRARYYDPAMGRFISEDPIGFQAGDANIYRYVGNAATIATDPTGLAASGGQWEDVGEPVNGRFKRTMVIRTGHEERTERFEGGYWRTDQRDRFIEVNVYEQLQTQRRTSQAALDLEERIAEERADADYYAGRGRDMRAHEAGFLYLAGATRGRIRRIWLAMALAAEIDARRYERLAADHTQAANTAEIELATMNEEDRWDSRVVLDGEKHDVVLEYWTAWRFKEFGWEKPSGGGSDGGDPDPYRGSERSGG